MIAIKITLHEEEAAELARFVDRVDFDTARQYTESFSPHDIRDACANHTMAGLTVIGKALAEQGWLPPSRTL